MKLLFIWLVVTARVRWGLSIGEDEVQEFPPLDDIFYSRLVDDVFQLKHLSEAMHWRLLILCFFWD